MGGFLITDFQRKMLKQPLGELVTGTTSECNSVLKRVHETEKPPRLILVGDTISRNAIEATVRPDVVIIDQREMRSPAVRFAHGLPNELRVNNPAGTIESVAWQTIERAIASGDTIVLVDGEEDLLTLVAILVAPLGSIVAYGQPGQGIVLVRVSTRKKREIQQIVDGMEKKE